MNVKETIVELWKKGHRAEARELLRIAKSLSAEDRNLQFKIFDEILSDMGLTNPRLSIDAKRGVASFFVTGMSLIEFPRFLERLLRNLGERGTRDYKLDKVDRSDPMRVYIKI